MREPLAEKAAIDNPLEAVRFMRSWLRDLSAALIAEGYPADDAPYRDALLAGRTFGEDLVKLLDITESSEALDWIVEFWQGEARRNMARGRLSAFRYVAGKFAELEESA